MLDHSHESTASTLGGYRRRAPTADIQARSPSIPPILRQTCEYHCGVTYGPEVDCGTNVYRDAVDAGTLSLTYTFHGSRLSPYLLAGVGEYRVAYTQNYYPCDPGPSCISSGEARGYHDRTTRFGTSAGVGLALRLWRADVIAEARYHAYSRSFGKGHMIPVTLGVRL